MTGNDIVQVTRYQISSEVWSSESSNKHDTIQSIKYQVSSTKYHKYNLNNLSHSSFITNQIPSMISSIRQYQISCFKYHEFKTIKYQVSPIRYQVSAISYKISSTVPIKGLNFNVISTRKHGKSRKWKLQLPEFFCLLNELIN